jgi:hypothetical protein
MAGLLRRDKKRQERIDELESAQQSRANRKKKTADLVGDNVDGYQETLIKYSKRFALMEAPWVPVAAFGPKVAAPSAPPEDIYSPDAALYLQHMTARIYARTPQKFHALVDATEFGPFSSNVCIISLKP